MKEQSHCDVAQGEDLEVLGGISNCFIMSALRLGSSFFSEQQRQLCRRGGRFRLQIMALIQVTVQRCIAAQDRPAKSASGDSTKVSRPLIFFFFLSEAGRGPCERERRVAQS